MTYSVKETLRECLDSATLATVLDLLAEICYEKSENPDMISYEGDGTAEWEQAAEKIEAIKVDV